MNWIVYLLNIYLFEKILTQNLNFVRRLKISLTSFNVMA